MNGCACLIDGMRQRSAPVPGAATLLTTDVHKGLEAACKFGRCSARGRAHSGGNSGTHVWGEISKGLPLDGLVRRAASANY